MADTSLHEVYKAIGALTSEVKGLRRDVQDDRTTAAGYRAGVRDDLSKIVMRVTHVERDVHSLRERTDDLQAVTDDVKSLRHAAIGAGTLGRWLLKIGGWLLSAAAGAASAWYALTGRPPP